MLDVARVPRRRASASRDGGSALDPHVVARLLSARAQDDPLDDLTPREREVLELMAQGLTNVGIAKRLFLSERTVEAHVRHVLLKLGVPEGEDAHRRVLAVLAHCDGSGLTAAPNRSSRPPNAIEHAANHAQPRASPARTSVSQCTPSSTRDAATATASPAARPDSAMRTRRLRPRESSSAAAAKNAADHDE